MTSLADAAGRARLSELYRATLLEDVMPFWLRHGLDREHGGISTALDRNGSRHRDGSLSKRATGNPFKGPFHLP